VKPASAELLALLATRQFFAADIYTFSGGNLGSNVLRYCGGDQNLTVNGLLYPAGGQVGPYFDRKDNKAKCHWKVGVEVDQLVFDVLPGSSTIFGTGFLAAVRQGTFDGAELLLERVYMPTYGDTRRGTVRYFLGRVAEVDAGRSVATFTVNSHLELLNLELPINLYQPGCVNSLGDPSCGVSPIPSTTGTVTSGSTAAAINATLAGGPFAAGTFDLGTILFTSGALDGLELTAKQVVLTSPATVFLLGYFPSAPSTGDTFTLFFGCDKTTGPNGCPKFNNLDRYRGFPFVPQPATAL
jgi:uncharacterized phage protein (TIGR02218 family)